MTVDDDEDAKKIRRLSQLQETKCLASLKIDSKQLSHMGLEIDFDESDKSCRSKAKQTVEGGLFQAIIISVILANAVVIFLDPGPDSEDAKTFIVIDCCFLSVYIAELVVKLMVLRGRYFLDGWNALDFICVVLGMFGVVTTVLVEAGVLSASSISSEMLLIRLGRVFKMIRVVRVVAIFKFIRKLQAKLRKESISPDLAVHLELIFTLRGFIQAHMQSHRKFLKYFGAQNFRCACGNRLLTDSDYCRKCGAKRHEDMPRQSSITGCEHARCMLESWTAVYHAGIVASHECSKADDQGHWILEGLEGLRETTEVTERLADFILEAAEDGVILHKDAEKLIHPMHEHLKTNEFLIRDTHAGIHRKALQTQCSGDFRKSDLMHDITIGKADFQDMEQWNASIERELSDSSSDRMVDDFANLCANAIGSGQVVDIDDVERVYNIISLDDDADVHVEDAPIISTVAKTHVPSFDSCLGA
jgi:hypothetical protein